MDSQNKPGTQTVTATDEPFGREPILPPEPGCVDAGPILVGDLGVDSSEPIPPPSR